MVTSCKANEFSSTAKNSCPKNIPSAVRPQVRARFHPDSSSGHRAYPRAYAPKLRKSCPYSGVRAATPGPRRVRMETVCKPLSGQKAGPDIFCAADSEKYFRLITSY